MVIYVLCEDGSAKKIMELKLYWVVTLKQLELCKFPFTRNIHGSISAHRCSSDFARHDHKYVLDDNCKADVLSSIPIGSDVLVDTIRHLCANYDCESRDFLQGLISSFLWKPSVSYSCDFMSIFYVNLDVNESYLILSNSIKIGQKFQVSY